MGLVGDGLGWTRERERGEKILSWIVNVLMIKE